VIAALARPSLARVFRTPRALLALGAWGVLALGFALAARSRGSANGADHVLVGAYGALILPLLAYTLVGAVLGARSLAASTAPLVGFGAAPRQLQQPQRDDALRFESRRGEIGRKLPPIFQACHPRDRTREGTHPDGESSLPSPRPIGARRNLSMERALPLHPQSESARNPRRHGRQAVTVPR